MMAGKEPAIILSRMDAKNRNLSLTAWVADSLSMKTFTAPRPYTLTNPFCEALEQSKAGNKWRLGPI